MFLAALADEADNALDLLFALKRAWFAAVSLESGGIRSRPPRSTSSPQRRWSRRPHWPPGSAWR